MFPRTIFQKLLLYIELTHLSVLSHLFVSKNLTVQNLVMRTRLVTNRPLFRPSALRPHCELNFTHACNHIYRKKKKHFSQEQCKVYLSQFLKEPSFDQLKLFCPREVVGSQSVRVKDPVFCRVAAHFYTRSLPSLEIRLITYRERKRDAALP